MHCGLTDVLLLDNDHVDPSTKNSKSSAKRRKKRNTSKDARLTQDSRQAENSGDEGASFRTLSNMSIPDMLVELKKCQPLCVMCHRRKSRQEQQAEPSQGKQAVRARRIKAERSAHVNSVKRNIGQCEGCGLPVTDGEEYLFDFDHIDPETKTASLANLIRAQKHPPVLDQEIAKCRLLCAYCHRVRTAQQLKWCFYTQATPHQLALAEGHLQALTQVQQAIAAKPRPTVRCYDRVPLSRLVHKQH